MNYSGAHRSKLLSLPSPPKDLILLEPKLLKFEGKWGCAEKDYEMSIPPSYLLFRLKKPNGDETAFHR